VLFVLLSVLCLKYFLLQLACCVVVLRALLMCWCLKNKYVNIHNSYHSHYFTLPHTCTLFTLVCRVSEWAKFISGNMDNRYNLPLPSCSSIFSCVFNPTFQFSHFCRYIFYSTIHSPKTFRIESWCACRGVSGLSGWRL
jgi:hypothetical protein